MSSELIEIAELVTSWSNSDEQVEAVVTSDRETEVRAYEGEIESLTVAESQGIGVRVIKDGRQGFAYAGTLEENELLEVLSEARDNASFASPDEFSGLAEPDGVKSVSLEVYSDGVNSLSTSKKIDYALELERLTLSTDKRISGIESSEYTDVVSESAIATSTGIRSSSKESGCCLMVYALAEENNETQTGFGFSIGRTPEDLDIAKAAFDASDRATRMLGSIKPKSERLTVVLDPWVSAQFLQIVGSTLSAEMVLKGRSLFADRLGEEVASPIISLVDDPTNPQAFTATETDGEGLATRRNVLIENGELKMFLHNVWTARKASSTSTGSAIRSYASTPGVGIQAISLNPGGRDPVDLIAGIDNGILIQSVTGLHSGVNPISGDFSTGAEGLRISNGELSEPLREFTIGSTIQKMLKDVSEVGNDLEWLPMSSAGSTVVINELTVSGA